MDMHPQWLRDREAAFQAALTASDEDDSAAIEAHLRQAHDFGFKIATTPARTKEGALVQLALLREWLQEEVKTCPKTEAMVCSIYDWVQGTGR